MENRFNAKDNESKYYHLAKTLDYVGSELKSIKFEVKKGWPQIVIAFNRPDGTFEPGMRLFFRSTLTKDEVKFLEEANISDADLVWGAYTEKKTVTDPETGEVTVQTVTTVAQKPSVIGLVANGKAWEASLPPRQYVAGEPGTGIEE